MKVQQISAVARLHVVSSWRLMGFYGRYVVRSSRFVALRWGREHDRCLAGADGAGVQGAGAAVACGHQEQAPVDLKLLERLVVLEVPETCREIGRKAFAGCVSVRTVRMPRSVTAIRNQAFAGCSSLKSLTISDRVTRIEPWAFEGCCSLRLLSLPHGLVEIGTYAFNGCTSLESLSIPESVTHIGARAFSGCSSLIELTIPASMSRIEPWTFRSPLNGFCLAPLLVAAHSRAFRFQIAPSGHMPLLAVAHLKGFWSRRLHL